MEESKNRLLLTRCCFKIEGNSKKYYILFYSLHVRKIKYKDEYRNTKPLKNKKLFFFFSVANELK